MKKELEQKRDDLKAQLKAQLKEIKKRIKELDKPVDGWYFTKRTKGFMYYLQNSVYQFGINVSGKWGQCEYSYDSNFDYPATLEESNRVLTEFVNGLGYIEGVTIKGCFTGNEYLLNRDPLRFEKLVTNINHFAIVLGDLVIWSSGKGWAKIVQPKFKVELIRKESSGLTVIEITHDSSVNSDELSKRIENFLNQ